MFAPYHCPRCGVAVVFKRILTIEEAAYMAAVSVPMIKRWMANHELRYRLFEQRKNHSRLQKVIDTVDLIEKINKRYPYPDQLDPTRKVTQWYHARLEKLDRGRTTWRANRAAKAAALEQQTQLPINPDEAQVAAFRVDRGESPEDEAGEDQSDTPETRTDDTQPDPDTQGRPLR